MEKYNNYQLAPHNTFHVKARAAEFVEYNDTAELADVFRAAGRLSPNRLLFIGGGSNLLFTGDYPGTVAHGNIRGIEIIGGDSKTSIVRVGAAVPWDAFVEWTLDNELYGIENLSLIPGETGAAAVQNIGAYGTEASETIVRVETIGNDLKEHVFNNVECHYSYRNSVFKQAGNLLAVHHVVFRLQREFRPILRYKALQQAFSTHGNDITARQVRNFVISMRRDKLPDPAVLGNAGSFFINPVVDADTFCRLRTAYPSMPHYESAEGYKIPAAWLIEKCGWKGKRVGNVGVYPRQPLVIVNYGGARAGEILDLCTMITSDVENKFGIRLCPEVQFV